jgi:hypothetical protein
MLRSLKDLERYTVHATDGDIGYVVNFLFDDQRWTVRYLIVKTSGLFEGEQVLISPISFRRVDWSTRRFELALTKDKVRHSPSVDADKPVSRQQEWDYYQYYQYPHYWEVPGIWGVGAHPELLAPSGDNSAPIEHPADVHLRSAKEVRGYHIQESDEEIGHVDDFIVDDETWELRYLVVDTSNWWFGKKVLIAPQWTDSISWEKNKVYVNMTRDAVKNSPEWDATAAINREYEVRLYDFYGRPLYWEGGHQRVEAPPAHHSVARPR